MKLQSFAFDNNGPLPPRFRGVNPPLDIIGVPPAAKSLALIMHDPDAVHGDFVHWTIFDIDPTTTEILEGGAPSGATEGLTTTDLPGYVGPRPPKGTGRHHYTFELYALDTLLDLLPATPLDELVAHIQKHTIARASLVGIVDA